MYALLYSLDPIHLSLIVPVMSLFFIFNFYLFMCFWLCRILVAALGLSLASGSGVTRVAVRWPLVVVASLVMVHRL